ncbi:MAG: CBS domain-containing protein [bacterium]
MIAKHLITGSITPLKTSDTGAFALTQMEEYHLMHLPIVNEVDFLGVLSESEVLAINELDQPIGSYRLSQNRAYVTEGQHIFEVIRTFAALKLTMLPVLDEKGYYLGMITMGSLCQHLAEMTSIINPGGIIVLEINNNDYNLSEIARIVESNDAKVLSLYITSHPDSTKMDVALKINRIDIGPVLQTFFRYNYIVRASWSNEDAYNDDLRDRFDSLMNYLNV